MQKQVAEQTAAPPAAPPPAAYGAASMTDLEEHINWKSSEAFNQTRNSSLENILKQGPRDQEGLLMTSDADETLLLNIAFATKVKLHSVEVRAPEDGRAPRSLKLFINRTNFGFDEAEDVEPEQKIELSDDALGTKILLKFVKFQNVDRLWVYVDGNLGDTESSAISMLKFWGTTVQTTNMKEFKRVAGEAGEGIMGS
mmetsp:Transcript_13978/g.23157  ORF Transcript_13978/g.23157 Transcript_13978/m.23157 type:complete len:198 (+) Transcript_13978:49-642(+)